MQENDNSPRWYIAPNGRLFRVSRVDGGWEYFVQIHDFTNFNHAYPVSGFDNFFWKYVDSPACVRAIQLFTQGGRRLNSLADMPVRYYPVIPGNDKKHDVPWVLFTLDEEERFLLDLKEVAYETIPAKDVKSGARLTTRAVRLFEMVYGDLSLCRDTCTFLGPWREAAEYHVAKIQKAEETYQNGTWGPPGSGNYLSRYVVDARLQSLESNVLLAYVYFGQLDLALIWACELWRFQTEGEGMGRLKEIARAIADDEFYAMVARHQRRE